MAEKSKRISFLDGLRGVAIVMVLMYHAYARWPAIVPYGDHYSGVVFFKYGWLGVHLFFIISGFVILMTLEKTANFFQFMYHRWLRLFPAMLIVSIFVFLTAKGLFPERPAGIPGLRDLLPGLTFISDSNWAWILHSHQGLLEGAFWSLFVEVKFYMIFGGIFYIFGVNPAILTLAALFICHAFFHDSFIWRFSLSAENMGWFAAGAMFYRYFKSTDRKWLAGGCLMALLSAGFLPQGTGAKLAAAFISRGVRVFRI